MNVAAAIRATAAGMLLLAGADAAAGSACHDATPWPQADRLFRGDSAWRGADGAFSVDLGDERVLWLFGDTWIDPSARGTRDGATMIRNSVAIQQGLDPSTAGIDFYWRHGADGAPLEFLATGGDEWIWPGHGVPVGERLVLFFNRVRGAGEGLGFESAGWGAMMVENPDEAPDEWRIRALDTPIDRDGVIVGFASVLRHDDFVYAFGTPDAVKSHPVFAARWTPEQLARGDLLAPAWWGGDDVGWFTDLDAHARVPLFDHGQSELTIHYDAAAARFLAVQSVGFGPADIALREAAEIIGPWSPPRIVFRPPEHAKRDIMIYAAKAQPALQGDGLVVTYVTNSFRFENHLNDPDLYYPRFVRLRPCPD